MNVVDPGIDTTDAVKAAQFRLLMGTRISTAEFEAHLIGQRRREANVIARQQGRAVQGRPAPGWKIVGPQGRRRLVPNKEERVVMRRIVHMRDSLGMTRDAISRTLVDEREFWKKPTRKARGGYNLEF